MVGNTLAVYRHLHIHRSPTTVGVEPPYNLTRSISRRVLRKNTLGIAHSLHRNTIVGIPCAIDQHIVIKRIPHRKIQFEVALGTKLAIEVLG